MAIPLLMIHDHDPIFWVTTMGSVDYKIVTGVISDVGVPLMHLVHIVQQSIKTHQSSWRGIVMKHIREARCEALLKS